MIRHERHQRDVLDADQSREQVLVDAMAAQLREFLESASDELSRTNIHGAGSAVIQRIVGQFLVTELTFRTEVVLDPEIGFVTKARADFYFPLSESSGIIAEVERGGVTANNHDLKDLWKTHLTSRANHLFLVVPNELFSADGRVRERPFPKVVNRLRAFFGDPRREIDVASVNIFGY